MGNIKSNSIQLIFSAVKSIGFAALFGVLMTATVAAQMNTQQRVEDFKFFWNAYKDAYIGLQLKNDDYGVDWDATYHEFLPKVEQSSSDVEFYRLITEAIALLRDGHSYVNTVRKCRETEPFFYHLIKFMQIEGNRVIVSDIHPKSTFVKAGVQRGYELLSIDGKTIRQIAKQHRKIIFASSDGQFRSLLIRNWLAKHNPLLGPPPSPSVEMTFRDLEGKLINVKSKWLVKPPKESGKQKLHSNRNSQSEPIEGQKQFIDGPLKKLYIRFYKDFNIARLRIPTWVHASDSQTYKQVNKQLGEAFALIKNTDGLLLDLRGNGGGNPVGAALLACYLTNASVDQFEQQIKPIVGYVNHRYSKTRFRSHSKFSESELERIFTSPKGMLDYLRKDSKILISKKKLMEFYHNGMFKDLEVKRLLLYPLNPSLRYHKPVIALVDSNCFSTTDYLVTLLDDLDRADFVGSPNGAGSQGHAIKVYLPNSGLQVHIPTARVYPQSGRMIESRPIKMDLQVSRSLEDLLGHRDIVKIEGIRYLLNKIKPESPRNEIPLDGIEYRLSESKPVWSEISTPDWLIQTEMDWDSQDY